MKIRKYRSGSGTHLDHAYVRDTGPSSGASVFWCVDQATDTMRRYYGIIVKVADGWQMTTSHPLSPRYELYGPVFDTPEACALWWEMQS